VAAALHLLQQAQHPLSGVVQQRPLLLPAAAAAVGAGVSAAAALLPRMVAAARQRLRQQWMHCWMLHPLLGGTCSSTSLSSSICNSRASSGTTCRQRGAAAGSCWPGRILHPPPPPLQQAPRVADCDRHAVLPQCRQDPAADPWKGSLSCCCVRLSQLPYRTVQLLLQLLLVGVCAVSGLPTAGKRPASAQ